MNRSDFDTEEDYHKYKKRRYDLYYKATALYPRKRWTPGEVQIVKECGLTDRELSAILKRSIKSIQHKRARCRGTEV